MLAATRAYRITQAVRSKAFDIFRLLIDSMNFSEGNDDGWNILETLCFCASRSDICDLLLWTLQQSSFELKTNIIDERYAKILYWTLMPGHTLGKASDLLLNLGGVGIINAPDCGKDGYTILHRRLLWNDMDGMRVVVARGPDLHRQGINTDYTPYKESPTSLAMYSSRVFSYWLRALANIDVDLENFINKELEQNSEVHPGWEKDTLVALCAHGDRPDLYVPYIWTCSDCTVRSRRVLVQPYWRHLLENIKERRYHEDSAPPGPEVAEEEDADRGNAGEAVSSNSRNPTYEPDTTRNVPLVNLEEESESEEDGSKQCTTTPIRSDCMYGKHEVVCMGCWLHYEKTGTRWQDAGTDEDSSETEDSLPGDASSEDEYSPFLIHS